MNTPCVLDGPATPNGGSVQQDGCAASSLNTVCQDCGEDCEIWQEVRTSYGSQETELWCYCKACEIDTFHPMPVPHNAPAHRPALEGGSKC